MVSHLHLLDSERCDNLHEHESIMVLMLEAEIDAQFGKVVALACLLFRWCFLLASLFNNTGKNSPSVVQDQP